MVYSHREESSFWIKNICCNMCIYFFIKQKPISVWLFPDLPHTAYVPVPRRPGRVLRSRVRHAFSQPHCLSGLKPWLRGVRAAVYAAIPLSPAESSPHPRRGEPIMPLLTGPGIEPGNLTPKFVAVCCSLFVVEACSATVMWLSIWWCFSD